VSNSNEWKRGKFKWYQLVMEVANRSSQLSMGEKERKKSVGALGWREKEEGLSSNVHSQIVEG